MVVAVVSDSPKIHHEHIGWLGGHRKGVWETAVTGMREGCHQCSEHADIKTLM